MLLGHERRHQNQWLPGLTEEGRPATTIHLPGYFAHTRPEHQRGGHGELYLPDVEALLRAQAGGAPFGYVQVDRLDRRQRVVERFLGKNLITTLGRQAMLKGGFGVPGTAANFIGVDQSLACATINALINTSTVTTTVTVSASGPVGYPGGNPTFQTANAGSTFQSAASNNGTKQNNNNVGGALTNVDTLYGTGILLSFGTANVEGCAGSVTANTATNINTTSFTTAHAHAVGEWAVASGSTEDNPTSAPTGVAWSTAQTPAPTGAGIATVQVVLTYTWAAGVLASGLFGGLWLATSTTAGAGIWYARAPMTPQNVGASNGLQVTWTIKV